MMTAWDQCASSFDNSPTAATIETTVACWFLDLPRQSAVSFGMSGSAGSFVYLNAAHRSLLARQGWDFNEDELVGAPEIRVVISEKAHITIRKALHLMGFGNRILVEAPLDAQGRIDLDRLPALDDMTLLCLQTGEVNTSSFDPFAAIIPTA
jgi:glutamate/tyrosine decarboxylase-like PLP-dependent enzyme